MSYRIDLSRATEPMFYRAPHPEQMTPMPYQYAGVEYRLGTRSGNGMIGDAPGLGKTAEGIMTSNALEAKRTLVTCPASLILNWEREVWKWSTIENVSTYPVLAGKDGVSNQAHYVFTSFAMLRNESILDAIMDINWDHWIIDEAHALKDPKGNKTTHIMCAPDLIRSVVGSITCATGTPMPNQPIEVYNLIRLLDWDAIGRASVDGFREVYYERGEGFITKLNPKTGRYEPEWSNKVRNQPRYLDELQEILREHIMVRRLKPQVLPQLPPKQWHPFPIESSADVRAVFNRPEWRRVEELWEMDPDAFDHNLPIDGAISTALRELGEAKAPLVAEYIDELVAEGVDKIVVGGWHRTSPDGESVLHYLRERLAHHGVVYMDGTTPHRRRQQAVDDFQTRDDVKIILGQLGPLGEGWTLTRAQDVVLAEFYWTPGKNDQFLDRIHRIGQTGDHVIGHVPLIAGSIEERVMSRAITKSQWSHQALDAIA